MVDNDRMASHEECFQVKKKVMYSMQLQLWDSGIFKLFGHMVKLCSQNCLNLI